MSESLDRRLAEKLGRDLQAPNHVAELLALRYGRRPEAVRELTVLLHDPVFGRSAAEALGCLGGAGAAEALRAVWDPARTADAVKRGERLALLDVLAVAVAQARLGDPVAAPTILELALFGRAPEIEGAWHVRLEAVKGLVWLPGPEAVRALLVAHDDPDAEIAEAAVYSLRSFGTVACVEHWLAGRGPARAVEVAIRALFGHRGPAQSNTGDRGFEDGRPWPPGYLAKVRRWWKGAAGEIPSGRCTWMGSPASPGDAIERLTSNADGGLARTAPEHWTGIDFVYNLHSGVAGTAEEVDRAREWWREHEATWEVGALYRGGRKHDLAPIVSALASTPTSGAL
jgi:hypothetical protein